MAKRRSSSDGKKLLAILVMLVIVITPVGQHAYMGVATFFSKIVEGAFLRAIPQLPHATPSGATSPSK